MQTCTWAATTPVRTKLFKHTSDGLTQPYDASAVLGAAAGAELTGPMAENLAAMEESVDNVLVAQRWFGSGSSSFDAYAMSAMFLAWTSKINVITAVHPGFVFPAPTAKWGATLSRMSAGRWAINVVSGWNVAEYGSFGIPMPAHDERYKQSIEFVEILRSAWTEESTTYEGKYFSVEDLVIEPGPTGDLTVYQGGQSDAAIDMAVNVSDWMFLNGGSLEKTREIIERVRATAGPRASSLKFALYAAPLCRATDEQAVGVIDEMAEKIDWEAVKARQQNTDTKGMWSDWQNKLSALDMNEGYASNLIGSPDTVMDRIREFQEIGVDMLHLSLNDDCFNTEVLPHLRAL